MKHFKTSLIITFTILIASKAISQNKNTPIGTDGISTIIKLFNDKPIVALGETHGHVQLYEFLTKLVQTEGFYKNVNDILIESGNALYQQTLDDYIFGGDVPFNELQKVWFNTTQSPVDPWSSNVYYDFLKTIRILNKTLPIEYKIRVIASDPPIEWAKVNTKEDYLKARGSRDEYYAKMVINNVLSKNRKALLINGGAHFGNHSPKKNKVNQRIEKEYPNSVTVILARSGLWKGNEEKEKALNWSSGTIAKVKDTWIGLLPGPRRMSLASQSSNNSNVQTISSSKSQPSKHKRQDYFDYLLYLGKAEDLTYGEVDKSIYLSDKVWKELNRRSMIRFNNKLTLESRTSGILRPTAHD